MSDIVIEGNVTIGPGIWIGDIPTPTIVRTAFTSSGNFTVPSNVYIVSANLLLIGGGGGAGLNQTIGPGSGGGAGGFISNLNIIDKFIAGSSYVITVGSGGSANSNGTNSSAFGYTAIGGGQGNVGGPGGNGGSGGGGTVTKTGTISAYGNSTQANLGYGSGNAGRAASFTANVVAESGGGGSPGSTSGRPSISQGYGAVENNQLLGNINTLYCAGGSGEYYNISSNTYSRYARSTSYKGAGGGDNFYPTDTGQDGLCVVVYSYVPLD